METTRKRPPMSCDTCLLRKKAEKAPTSFLGRLWIWHTAFCPGWKRYVTTLRQFNEAPPAVGHQRGNWEK